MKECLVSIGMPVYNCESTVAESIASVLNQTFENWELIIYDDGSTDRTVAIARQFTDRRIHIKVGSTNCGLPACLNKIVAGSRSQFFARMDGDDVAYPERLEKQLEFLRSHREVDLVAGSILVFRSDGVVLGARRGALTHEQICAHPWSGIPMAHPTWMGKTEWFLRNPYNAEMVRMEDWELLFRTYGTSRFANLPQILLGYREDSLSLRKILLARRNRCRTLLSSPSRSCSSWRRTSALTGQFARSLVDIAALGLKLDYRILKYRALPVSSDEIAAWQAVLERTRDRAADAIRSFEAVPA